MLLWLLWLLLVSGLSLAAWKPLLYLALLLQLAGLALAVDLRALWKQSLWVVPMSLCALPQGWLFWGGALARALLCVQAGLLVAWSLTPPVLLQALGRLGMPARLLAVLRFAIRYLELLSHESERCNRARELRQGAASPSLKLRWKALGQVVASLFLRTLERAERVSQAMRTRGYCGQLPSRSTGRNWRVSDTVAMLHGLAWLGLALCWS